MGMGWCFICGANGHPGRPALGATRLAKDTSENPPCVLQFGPGPGLEIAAAAADPAAVLGEEAMPQEERLWQSARAQGQSSVGLLRP